MKEEIDLIIYKQNPKTQYMVGHLEDVLKPVSYTHLTLPTNREV